MAQIGIQARSSSTLKSFSYVCSQLQFKHEREKITKVMDKITYGRKDTASLMEQSLKSSLA